MSSLLVAGGRSLTGTVHVPGDKSISHRALLLGAIAGGVSVVRNLSDGDDVMRTGLAINALGATVETHEDHTSIRGCSDRLTEPERAIDCGNSGTTIRLLAGVVAGRGWDVTLVGDASLSSRPMDRVAEPLEMMGATVRGNGSRHLPPLLLGGDGLKGIDYTPRNPSAQVKSCVLLAGLHAEGQTTVREAVPTRRHTEEMLAACSADVEESYEDGFHVVRVSPGILRPLDMSIPGDPSQAAFWVVAGCVVPGSNITLPAVYAGEGRRGFLDVLVRMGADIREQATDGASAAGSAADIVIRYGALSATDIASAEITGLDEVPVLAIAASRAKGTTTFHDVSELRVKESDRLAGVAGLLRSFGANCEVSGDDLIVHGSTDFHSPGTFDPLGDHRMAMAAAVAALCVEDGTATEIRGWECVATSYPGFARDLDALAGEDR